MSDSLSERLRRKIIARALPEGGFPSSLGDNTDLTQPPGLFGPDIAGEDQKPFGIGCIQACRGSTGRREWICLSRNYPQSFWPTSLAVLAWHNLPRTAIEAKGNRLFASKLQGSIIRMESDSPVAHDLPFALAMDGETHSWVEPTSLVLMALGIVEKETTHG